METIPQLSVVMATYQRAVTIKRTLRCLAEQDLEPVRYEVIMVDDGSTDATAEVVEQAKGNMPFALTYLRHENAGPGYTQNRGIRIARGQVIMLMADDIWMEPQTLRRHLDFHLQQYKDDNSALVGRVYQSPELNQTVFLRNYAPHQMIACKDIIEVPYYLFWACNVSLKKQFMLDHGMFRDERGWAGAAAHEDPEVGYRLMLAGMKLYYDSQATAMHHHVEEFGVTLDRMYQRGLNFGAFRQQVGQPELSVAYHVLNLTTLRDHWRIYSGERKEFLFDREKNPLRMAVHYLLRSLVFNRVTIKLFWLPLLQTAEKNTLIESIVTKQFYHGVLAYYFQRGAAAGNRKFDNPAEMPR